MPDTREEFDRINEALDAPLVVVTAADHEEAAGCVVGFHSQCSIDPPRYAVWISRANRTYRVALHSSHLGVHLLTPADRRLGEWFGGTTGDEVDTFADLAVDRGPGGVPLLRDLPVRFVGERVAMLEGDGDHTCFIVEAVEARGPGGDDDEAKPLRVSGLDHVEPGHPSEEGAED
jgi:flavin reductase (DIM6/NTAB) family NADH-FMN oxidoreductase RutF